VGENAFTRQRYLRPLPVCTARLPAGFAISGLRSPHQKIEMHGARIASLPQPAHISNALQIFGFIKNAAKQSSLHEILQASLQYFKKHYRY
jgi:hypothetical protein